MLYSLVGILSALVILIINHDVLFHRNYPYHNRSAFITYRILIWSVLTFLLVDICWGFLDILDNKIYVSIDTNIFFFIMMFTVLIWSRFIIFYLQETYTVKNVLTVVGYLFLFTGIAFVITNFFYPILFTYKDGQYTTGIGREIIYLAQIGMFFLAFIYTLVFTFRTHNEKRVRYLAIAITNAMMVTATLFQFFYAELPFYSLGCTAGLAIIHVFLVAAENNDNRALIKDSLRKQKIQSKELSDVKTLAYTDPLTGLKNKHAYVEYEANADVLIRENKIKDFCFLIFDLNDLKVINDTYGHEMGDKYIIKSCSLIEKFFPNLDVYRFGGDEFIVILQDDNFERRFEMIKAFNDEMEKNIGTEEPIIALGFSDYVPEKDNTLRSVFMRADERMYSRKRTLKSMGGKVNTTDTPAVEKGVTSNSRMAVYEMFYESPKFNLIDMLNESNADEVVEVDIKNDTFVQYYHVEGKYFVPTVDISFRDLVDFCAEHIVHPEDKGIFLGLMKIEGFFERLQNSRIPNFDFAHFRYKLQNGSYRYVEQCVIAGKENGIPDGKFRMYVFDIQNFKSRLVGNVGDEKNVISVGRDSVTGLFTGKDFFRRGQEMINEKPEEKWCLVSCDIEHFKFFSEWFGREKGDLLLASVGAELKECEQKLDGLAGYFGQDDFAFITIYSENKINTLYQSIHKHIDSFSLTAGLLPAFGIAMISPGLALVDAFDRATNAVSLAKKDIDNRIRIYDESMQFAAEHEYLTLTAFMKALQNDEITFYLQPQVRASSGAIVGAEALARWHKKDGTIVQPGDFVPILEKYGFITDLDKKIWEKVCIWLKDMLDQKRVVVPISVNVSRIDIFNTDIAKHFHDLCKQYNIPHHLLKIEITESAYAETTQKIDELVKKLQADGFLVLMDDFGSGYSSLNMLSNLKLNAIKLDANFLHIEGSDIEKGVHILESVINMAKSLALPIIVEGVETKQQCEFLMDLGCRYIQGFYFYKPMSFEKFSALIKDRKKVDERGFVVKINEQFRIREFLDKNIYSDSMLNNIIGSVALYSYDGEHVDIYRYNQQFYESVGVNEFAERLVNIEQFCPEEDRPLLFKTLDEAMNSKLLGSSCILRFYRPDNTVMRFRIHFYYLGKKEGTERFYGSASNVTELVDLKDARDIIARYSTDNLILIKKVSNKWQYDVVSHGLADIFNLTPLQLQEELNSGAFAKRVTSPAGLKKFMDETVKKTEDKTDFKKVFEIYDKDHKKVKVSLSFHYIGDSTDNYKYLMFTNLLSDEIKATPGAKKISKK